jgi:7,8-dihydro-6-hydroxymethylpterin-pyrophosphokinase
MLESAYDYRPLEDLLIELEHKCYQKHNIREKKRQICMNVILLITFVHDSTGLIVTHKSKRARALILFPISFLAYPQRFYSVCLRNLGKITGY